MNNFLHQSIPVWQLLVLVTVYVVYKELVKLVVKVTYKQLKNARQSYLAKSANEAMGPVELTGKAEVSPTVMQQDETT